MTGPLLPMLPYRDRREAGRYLGDRIEMDVALRDPVVVGLPRGGVPVAYEVAERLGAALDVMVVRKLGVPGHEELAMGAIAGDGMRVLNDEIVVGLNIHAADIERVAAEEQRELERREVAYRGGREPAVLSGRQVIVVDDGLATGASMRVAALAIRREAAAEVIVAAPVGAAETCEALSAVADRVVCVAMPEPFAGVGMWFRDFGQTTDAEVRDLLVLAWEREQRRADSKEHGDRWSA